MIKEIVYMSSLVLSFPAGAHSFDYYDAHAVGWHWYQDPIIERTTPPSSPPTKALLTQPPQPSPDPITRLHAAQKKIEGALDTAILTPTLSHVETYMRLQNKLSAQSAEFAAVWQRVLLAHPELDFSLSHPTEALALEVQQDKHNQQQDAAIRAFATRSGLFFFYKQACPYCARFAPIVQHFAKVYGITVIPITLDGKVLPEFPDSQRDKGQAALFGVHQTPALFAVNPNTHKAFPLAYGLTSESTLGQRIVQSRGLLE
jgi:conjugal transfer pilus assembly protein TraF